MTPSKTKSPHRDTEEVSLLTIAREWTRLGCIGFGGPPAHIALLRRMCVERHGWIDATEFEDAIATVNLLPGPASTQLAIFCAWRLRRTPGAIVGGLGFIVPGLVLNLALASLFLARHPTHWILAIAAGAGCGVPAVALHAAGGLAPASWRRMGSTTAQRARWISYAGVGLLAAIFFGPLLVLVLVAAGLTETAVRVAGHLRHAASGSILVSTGHAAAIGGTLSLVWIAIKVGALSYGGGFVIVPLMQHDAVVTYHWLSGTQFLNAVALGQITPGPVVLTTAVIGYAADGLSGGLLAPLVAFAPSFLFIIFGAPRFSLLRRSERIQSFLTGAGPAVIGAIAGSAIPLGRELVHIWQIPVLAAALVWLFVTKRSVISALLLSGIAGLVLFGFGMPV